MPENARDSYMDSCVRVIQELHDNAANGSRWLFDIDECGLDTGSLPEYIFDRADLN